MAVLSHGAYRESVSSGVVEKVAPKLRAAEYILPLPRVIYPVVSAENPKSRSTMSDKTSFSRSFATLAIALSAAFSTHAQLNTPAASPHSVLKQTVGLTEVEIDYSRPSMRGREIFGGLVPFGAVWRSGANDPTKISFSDDVELGGVIVPAGTYA